MKLYHGSNRYFGQPSLKYCKEKKDFGRGFYLTDEYTIAKNWSIRLRKRGFNTKSYLYTFNVDLDYLKKNFRVHTFQDSISWLDYIISNRTLNNNNNNDYDIVIGRIADDKTQVLVEEFTIKKGGLKASKEDKEAFIKILLSRDLKIQYCVKSDDALNYISRFMNVKEVF